MPFDDGRECPELVTMGAKHAELTGWTPRLPLEAEADWSIVCACVRTGRPVIINKLEKKKKK